MSEPSADVVAFQKSCYARHPFLAPADAVCMECLALALDVERKAGAQEACTLCHCCGERRHDGDDPCVSCSAERQRVWEEAAKRMDEASERDGSIAEQIAAEFRARAARPPDAGREEATT